MNYKTVKEKGYNLYVNQTDKFSTVSVDIILRKSIKKEDITKLLFLKKLLLRNNQIYKTSRDVNIAIEDKYISGLDINVEIVGNYINLSFSMMYINDKYIDANVSNNAISFLLDIMQKPDLFKQSEMDIVYNDLYSEITSLKEKPVLYALQQLVTIMEPNSPFSYSTIGYLEDLKEITKENLYEYYQTILKQEELSVFVVGEVIIDEIKNIINPYLNNRTNHQYEELSYLNTTLKQEVNYTKESLVTSQSRLAIGFKFDPLTEHEKQIIMPLFSIIYGGGADGKLFKTVREKYSLCYGIGAIFYKISNFLYVGAGISAVNYEQALKLTLMELNNIANGGVSELELDIAKTSIIENNKALFDNQNAILMLLKKNIFYQEIDLEVQEQLINNVTIKDIVDITNKIHLDTVFLLEGVANNE